MFVFNIIFPIFSIAVLGYLFAYFSIFKERDIAGLNKYVFNVAIPILLFNAMSNIELPDQIEWSFILVYFAVALLNFFIGNVIGSRWLNFKRPGQAVYGLGASYSNMVLIGLPVITTGLGDEALLPALFLISFHSAIMFSAVTLVAESGSTTGARRQKLIQPFIKIVQNPIIIGLIVGLLFNQLSLSLPFALTETVRLIRGSALPAALFVMGASLAKYKLSGHVGEASMLVLLKMLWQPLLVWALLTYFFPIDPLWRSVAIIVAGLPIGINAAVFANQYRAAVAPVSTAVILSTVLSIPSIALMLSIF